MIVALVPLALAELPWSCPEIAVPADARALNTDAGLTAAFDALEAEALAWTAGCAWTSEAVPDGTVETCLTDAGGKVEVEATSVDEYDGYETCTTETWSLAATLPAGATTWTAMALFRSETACAWSDVSEASARWSGTVGDLPADASFGLSSFYSSDYFGNMSGRSASTPACSWGVFDSWPWEGDFHSAWTSEHTVEVAVEYYTCGYHAYALVDDVPVGAVSPVSWALLPDADLDGWSVDDGDCDDADAAFHPCAYDPLDGVDQDCNGMDEIDADGDGWMLHHGDCNDADPATNPDATEIVCDGVDQNCDDDDNDGCPEGGASREPPEAAPEPDDAEEDPRATGPVRQVAGQETGGCGAGGAALLFVPLAALRGRRRRP